MRDGADTWAESRLRSATRSRIDYPIQWIELLDVPPARMLLYLSGAREPVAIEQGVPLCFGCPTSGLALVCEDASAPDRPLRYRHGQGCPPAPTPYGRTRQLYLGEKTREVAAGARDYYLDLAWSSPATDAAEQWSVVPKAYVAVASAAQSFALILGERIGAGFFSIASASATGTPKVARAKVADLANDITPQIFNTAGAGHNITTQAWLLF